MLLFLLLLLLWLLLLLLCFAILFIAPLIMLSRVPFSFVISFGWCSSGRVRTGHEKLKKSLNFTNSFSGTRKL